MLSHDEVVFQLFALLLNLCVVGHALYCGLLLTRRDITFVENKFGAYDLRQHNVMYQGATGNVRFDANGDVSAPAVVWKFTDGGTEEVQYLSLTDVDDFIASLN